MDSDTSLNQAYENAHYLSPWLSPCRDIGALHSYAPLQSAHDDAFSFAFRICLRRISTNCSTDLNQDGLGKAANLELKEREISCSDGNKERSEGQHDFKYRFVTSLSVETPGSAAPL
jgi:hypothetical protein